MESVGKQNGLKEKVKDIVDQVLPPNEVDLDIIKEEIWYDLSALYYKYEADEQKRAFREVMYDMCKKITEGNWDCVYRKLYRTEKKEKVL